MQNYTHISVKEAARLLEQGAVVVDVRDFESFCQGHIPGAFHLDKDSMTKFLKHADLAAPTIVVCYHGHVSQNAAAHLHSQGFKQVYTMDGGFTRWKRIFAEQVTHETA